MISFRNFLWIFLDVKHRVIADNFDTANLPRTKGTFLRYRDTGKPQSSIRLFANYACSDSARLYAQPCLNLHGTHLINIHNRFHEKVYLSSLYRYCASRSCFLFRVFFFRGTGLFINTPFPPETILFVPSCHFSGKIVLKLKML